MYIYIYLILSHSLSLYIYIYIEPNSLPLASQPPRPARPANQPNQPSRPPACLGKLVPSGGAGVVSHPRFWQNSTPCWKIMARRHAVAYECF